MKTQKSSRKTKLSVYLKDSQDVPVCHLSQRETKTFVYSGYVGMIENILE
jgi:hypothetical protein